MELLNDNLLAVLNKVVPEPILGIDFDGRKLGLVGETTADDVKAVIDTIKSLPFMTDRNKRIIISDFNQTFERPEDAYKFMRLVLILKNKFGTGIYHCAPFGNFTSLHYQGNIDFAVIPEGGKSGKKADAPAKAEKTTAAKTTKTRGKSAKSETKTPAKRTTRKRK